MTCYVNSCHQACDSRLPCVKWLELLTQNHCNLSLMELWVRVSARPWLTLCEEVGSFSRRMYRYETQKQPSGKLPACMWLIMYRYETQEQPSGELPACVWLKCCWKLGVQIHSANLIVTHWLYFLNYTKQKQQTNKKAFWILAKEQFYM